MAEDSGISLSEVRPLTGKTVVLAHHNLEQAAIDGWKPTRESCPQFNVLKRSLSVIPIHTPVLRRTFISDIDWEASKTYRRVSQPWGYHGDGTSLISKGLFKIMTCGFMRSRDQEDIRPETLITMAFMNKHLARAISMQNRILKVEKLLIESRNVLDLIEFGVVLYGPDKKVVFVNSSAQRIFEDGDGMLLKPSEIEVENAKAQQEFTKLLDTTCRENVALKSRSGGMLSIPRKSGRRAYTMTIVPMGGDLLNVDNITAVAFIFDPLKKQISTFNVLADCYRLTRAETELAIALMHGESLQIAAEKRGVSYNTMKTHLHAIFSKTNTNRQVDLVSLLLRSIAGFKLEN